MRPFPLICLYLTSLLLWPGDGAAMLTPPMRLQSRDSTSARIDRGVELMRATEYYGTALRLRPSMHLTASGRWRTDWQTPQGGTHRVRQDGRWYVGAQRSVSRNVAFWLASSGEHFDDRPFNPPPRAAPAVQNPVRSPQLESRHGMGTVFSESAVRLLRAGGGAFVQPWSPLKLDLGTGPVQDRRIGRLRSGVGIWSRAILDDWSPGGFEQSLDFAYNRETPKESKNEDLTLSYSTFRQFYEGNSNRTDISAAVIGRDIYIESTGAVARRMERRYALRDVLAYGIVRGVRVEMSGDISRSSTEQSQPNAALSSLEENQAGFAAALEVQHGRTAGYLKLGVQSVTQTIRGDILQGRKTDLAFRGRTGLHDGSIIALRLGVAKYVLDTRSETNYDDRDELRYTMDGSWSKPVFAGMVYELFGTVRLDHLVYIYRQNSANNRWSRFFLAGSALRHQPVEQFSHTLRVSVSANYQAYDFDTEPQTARSTVHRRFTVGDSAAWTLHARWLLGLRIDWQREEFGRLFWDSFEEERSDESRSLTAAAHARYQIGKFTSAGAGAIWDSRIGERFPVTPGHPRIVLQDLKSYGPLMLLEHSARRGLFLSMQGRALRQFQWGRSPRWIVTGEMLGGVRW